MHYYSVAEVRNAGYTLAPMKCIYCGSLEVTFDQYVNNAYCAECGRWQEDSPNVNRITTIEGVVSESDFPDEYATIQNEDTGKVYYLNGMFEGGAKVRITVEVIETWEERMKKRNG